MTNAMKKVKVEKVTLNIGAGIDPKNIKKAIKLLTAISGRKVVETKAKKRIATWKTRPGLPVGAKVTIRKGRNELLKRLLSAVENTLNKSSFTINGFSFGIPEYIDIPEVKYDPKIGIIGLDVCVTLTRPGFRIKKRRMEKKKLKSKIKINKEEAINFMKDEFGVKIK